ncbi:MAG: translation initiation factor IF-2 [Clostridia bacterium]
MDKHRVYELSKELNTTSKRLMEKLAEINIVVKNHMSLLNDDELSALYDHIGVIKHEEKKEEPGEKITPVTPPVKPEVPKEIKKGPRIIRTTKVVIETTKNDDDYIRSTPNSNTWGNQRKEQYNGNRDVRKSDYIKPADNNSGLMTGYTRNTGFDYGKDKTKNSGKGELKREPSVKIEKSVMTEVTDKTETTEKIDVAEKIIVDKKDEIVKVDEINKKSTEIDAETEVKQNKNVLKETKQKTTEVDSAEEKPTAKPINKTQEVGHNEVKSVSPQIEKTQPEKPQSTGYNRPQGERPQGTGYNRPLGDRPQGAGYNRTQQGTRPQGTRPQSTGYNARPAGDRPQGTGYSRPDGGRPQGTGYNRPAGDRPQGTGYNRPAGDRPQGTGYNRPAGNRPQGTGYNRPQGSRPQGTGYNKPQGGFRSQNDRNAGGRSLDIPKPEISDTQKDMLNSRSGEVRREFQVKDVDRDIKREQKREAPKGLPTERSQKYKPQSVILNEKKGVSEILSEDFMLQEFYTDNTGRRRRVIKGKKDARSRSTPKYIPPRAILKSIIVPEYLTVKDLAETLKKTSTEVIKKLMEMGMLVTLNQEIDYDTAALIADEFGIKAEKAIEIKEEDILFDDTEEDTKNAVTRPPVVVVMGHVDHGKTSLLDAIRETNVIESESGGITQHIGAYTIKIKDRNITFLDTPGHEAFTAMRARGAQVTDIAILVVAADDGVMPQTIEAINHAKAAKVAIIVAVNKIDKPGANPDKVKQELTEYGLVAEEWGGEAIFVNVSAKQRTNIDHLLEMVLLSADILELKADPKKQAKGTVIEAKLDKGRGPVATVLVQRGTLKLSDSVVTGTTVGRIRAMLDDKGHKVKKAGPSTPVEIVGLPEVPEAGEIFYAIDDEKVAKQLAEKRKLKIRESNLNSNSKISLEDLYSQIIEGKVKDLNLVVKADVQGSVEALKQSLENLTNSEVRVNIIHSGVGAITESDVTLASVSNAVIIGFNVRPGANVIDAAANAGVEMKLYKVIYNAINDVQAAMNGMLEPTYKEVIQGHAEIRQIIKVSSVGTIGGSYVTDGKITKNSDVRVVRDGIVVHEGKLDSLKRFKDDVKEVLQGFECGISLEKFNDIKEGDIIESYVMEEEKR